LGTLLFSSGTSTFVVSLSQDKVTINSLSMVAEDHASSKANARAIYECITQPLISRKVPNDRKLPLVYVIDSILKNVKGEFVSIIEEDAKKWMPLVYNAISETGRTKLKKVWNLWKDSGFFQESSWKEMGTCFASDGSIMASTAGDTLEGRTLSAKLKTAGITLAVRVTFSMFKVTLAPVPQKFRSSMLIFLTSNPI
jgi:CID domain